MLKYTTKIFFPYSVKNIYQMIKNIEEYPFFLPNCNYLIIKNKQKIKKNSYKNTEIELILAEMGIKYNIFKEKFISKIYLDYKNKKIKVNINSNSLKELNNIWHIIEYPNGCIAKFSIKINIKKSILHLILSNIFKIYAIKITKAFKNRADNLYYKK